MNDLPVGASIQLTPDQLASAQPVDDAQIAVGQSVQLSPAQQADARKAAGQMSPLEDFSAEQLAELQKQNPDFNLLQEYAARPDLMERPGMNQKIADAHNLLRREPFSIDVKKLPGQVWDIAKGFGKQAWNYAQGLVGAPVASLANQVTGDDEAARQSLQLGTRQIAENVAGTELAMHGLGQTVGAAKDFLARKVGLSKPLDQYSPEEKVADLFDALKNIKAQQKIVQGEGPILSTVGSEVVNELKQNGTPVRPDEVSELAAGDPFTWYLMGKAFHGATAAIPGRVSQAVGAGAEKLGDITTKLGGKTVETAGDITRLGAEATGKVAPIAGAVIGAVKGAEHGPAGLVTGLGLGYKAGKFISEGAANVAKKAETISNIGEQISGKSPMVSPIAQLGKDVLSSAPGAAVELGKGVAFDLGLAAVTSEESPEERANLGIGTVFGGLGAASRVAGRVLSGQIIAPRAYGVTRAIPSSGSYPALDAVHNSAIQNAAPGVVARLNAIRAFTKGVDPRADVFMAKDSASLQQALEQSGMSPEQAKTFSEQQGFFSATLPDKNGEQRRVIVVKNPDTAPHEAFHAIQDVLGEEANQKIDSIVKQAYASQWENEGTKYAARLVGPQNLQGVTWREAILDASGWGRAEAADKIARDVANKLRAQTGAEPNPDAVRDLANGEWARILSEAQKRNPNVPLPQLQLQAWRDVLSPAEAQQVGDRYIARELAAENFDAAFKHGGPELDSNPGVVSKLSNIVGNLVSAIGGEPVAGRVSEEGKVPLSHEVIKAVTETARGAQIEKPEIEPTPAKPQSRGIPTTPEAQQEAASEARDIASSAPDTAPAPKEPNLPQPQSPREILGTIAEAISQRSGVKINYLSAPEEPAAATTSNRPLRRRMIETFRSMPLAARRLWEKTFFPERVLRNKTGYQILGWAPEVFAANGHKVAQAIADITAKGGHFTSPYEVDVNNRTFTEKGWRDLYQDAQTFVQNQIAGRTGAGEKLVVPPHVTEQGFHAPPVTRGAESPLPQEKADFINMLFNFRLPDTARITGGKLPLNIAGQEVSAATHPGRLSIPVEPKPRFEGEAAKKLGIEGRSILEVNPARQALSQAAAQTGVEMPSMIEAIQRLNLEHISEVQHAPEASPEFRGNTLTLTAGFQPSKNPRAVKEAAVKDREGRIWTGAAHGLAQEKGMAEGAKFSGNWRDDGFITNDGEFLDREQAYQRALELQQIKQGEARLDDDQADLLEAYGLEQANPSGQFQPGPEEEDNFRLTPKSPKVLKPGKDFRITPGLVGTLHGDGEIEARNVASLGRMTHESFGFDHPDDVNWRYVPELKSLYYWRGTDDDISAIKGWLEAKGYEVKKSRRIIAGGPSSYEAHGQFQPKEAGEDVPGLLGRVNRDDQVEARSIKSLAKNTHADFEWDRSDAQSHWRYRPDTKTLFWWDDPDESGVREKVVSWLESKGYPIEQQRRILTGNVSRDQLQDRKAYLDAHGESGQFSPEQGEEEKPIGGLIGQVAPDGTIEVRNVKDLNNVRHEGFGMRGGLELVDAGGANWRYRPDNKTVYYWGDISTPAKDAISSWLIKKGYDIHSMRKIIAGGPSYTEAHGYTDAQFSPVESMQKLRDMSPEDWHDMSQIGRPGYFKSEQYGGGITGWAREVGSQARTAEDLQALKESNSLFKDMGREAMRDKNMNLASTLFTKAQAAREAFEFATGKKIDDPNVTEADIKAPAEVAGQFAPKDLPPANRNFMDLLDDLHEKGYERFYPDNPDMWNVFQHSKFPNRKVIIERNDDRFWEPKPISDQELGSFGMGQFKPAPFTDEEVEKIPGAKISYPARTYLDASKRAFEDKGNPYIRRSATPEQDANPDNSNRDLLVQITSDLMNPPGNFNMDTSKEYYDKLYSGKREGYTRMDDFWEIPQWMGFASHIYPNADVYVVRDMEQAKQFLKAAKYRTVMFSALDVNKPFIHELAKDYGGKVSVGGWIDPKYFSDLKNVTWHNDLKASADADGMEYKDGVDYRHFEGSGAIPRLNMSTGCKFQCAFCTVEKAVKEMPPELIKQQAEEIAKLGTELVYLGDKTFGQAKNYKSLSDLNEQIKAINPNFKGFVIQTTASTMPKFDPEWLAKSGIKFVELGIETYNDPILRNMHKPATEALMDKSVEALRKNGITLIPNIIIGLPGETEQTYNHTLDFLKKNADVISHANIYNLAVYPDSKIAKEITTASPDDYNENILEKSFHANPEVHRQFAGDLYGLAMDMLDKTPDTMKGQLQPEPQHIRDAEELWPEIAPQQDQKKEIAPQQDRKKEIVPQQDYSKKELASGAQNEENEGMVSGQFKPKKKQAKPEEVLSNEWKLKPATSGFSKAWILPDGVPVQLGGQWHHEWLNEQNDIRKRYGIPKDEEGGENRSDALRAGFARINYDARQGKLTFEAREKDWPNIAPSISKFIEANLGSIDKVQAYLFNNKVDAVADSGAGTLFDKSGKEAKLAAVPFLGAPSDITELSPQATAGALSEQAAPGTVPKRGKLAAGQFQGVPELEEEIKKIREGISSGQTFTPAGNIWAPGRDRKQDIVSLASVNVPRDEFTPEKFYEALQPYEKLLKEPNLVAGAYTFSKEGKPVVSIDVNALVPKKFRANTLEFAKANDQKAIWDAEKNEEVPAGGEGNTKLTDPEELALAARSLRQGKPYKITKPGETQKDFSLMGSDELSKEFPEAVVPENKSKTIPSEITKSPLYKQAENETEAVNLFAKKLVDFAKQYENEPLFKRGARWYSDFTPMLEKSFGKDAPMFAELLAATSPQTDPEQNFSYAVEALDLYKKGAFDKLVKKFEEGLEMLKSDAWEKWLARNKKGVEPTPARFLAEWIDKHQLRPKRNNGKLFGLHSVRVLQVLARKWLEMNAGPKTRNFVANLIGSAHDATIDLWADRTMRRLGYEGFKKQWRILPQNAAPVSDTDFAFAQKAFAKAADKLGMKPSALQGALWFAEKHLWAKNGWGKLDFGNFQNEMSKLSMIRGRHEHEGRLTKAENRVKVPEAQELFGKAQYTPMKVVHTIAKEDVGQGVYRHPLGSPARSLLTKISTKFGGINKSDIGKKVYRADDG